jgi:hypothetical protein
MKGNTIMNQEIILSRMFLNKLFKFYFVRNTKIYKTLIAINFITLLTCIYLIAFLIRLNRVIEYFSTSNYSIGIYIIIILILLIIITITLWVQYSKIYKESKFSFLDEFNKTYPINSTEYVSFEENTITSKNSGNNHMMIYNMSNIATYYKYNKIIIIQTLDDNFIYLELDNVYDEKIYSILKMNNIKKSHILKSFKKES